MMKFKNCALWVATAAALFGVLSGCDEGEGLKAGQPGSELKFAEVSLILERNVTDGDGELVLFVKGVDEGLARLKVFAPDGTRVLDLSTQERVVGLREFSVESAEPGVAAVLRAYPEGTYRIEGVTLSGHKLRASANLSHAFPAPPKLSLGKTKKTITWLPVADAAKYMIELEREIDGMDEMKLTMELPAASGSFSIPKEFQTPGDYQVGIAVHGSNGNITVVEKEFSRGK